jgi:hypothetical protein
MRAHEHVDVLVRVEAADVDEPPGAGGSPTRPAAARMSDGGDAARYDAAGASSATRMRAGLTPSTRTISAAEKSETVSTSRACHNASATFRRQKSRARAVGSVISGKRSAIRVVDRHHSAKAGRQWKVRVHRGREEHVEPGATDGDGEPQHVGDGARSVGGGGGRRRRAKRHRTGRHVGEGRGSNRGASCASTKQVKVSSGARAAMTGRSSRRETSVPAGVLPAGGVDPDVHV